MKKLFLMLILTLLFSSSYSQVQILEVIPIEKVTDTNETLRVDSLILENQSIWNNFLNYFTSTEIINLYYNRSEIDTKINSLNNFSGDYNDLINNPVLDDYNETSQIETLDIKFTNENTSIWNGINNAVLTQYNDTDLVNLINEVNINSTNRDNDIDSKFTNENTSIWSSFLNYFNKTQILDLFYNKTEIDSRLISTGAGNKFLSDSGVYLEITDQDGNSISRSVYPYVTSDINEQFRVSQTKSITIVGEGFTPSDYLQDVENEGYSVEYISKSPTQFILNITAPNIEKFASEYSFSGHEAWGNGKKIIFQTVDLFAKDLIKSLNINCFQKYNNDFYCVGYNQYANLAIGIDNTTSPILTPTKSVIENTTKVELINNANFALLENKTLVMWGRDSNGQFGLGNNKNELYYFNTTYLNGELIKDFSIGSNTICAIRDSDQRVYCSGYSSQYYEIPGYSSSQYTPVYASSIPTNLKQLQMGQRGGCYVRSDNRLYCWGWDNGRFGRGTTSQKLSSPTSIASSIEKFDMGYSYHMCYLTTSKQIKCSGSNNKYQVGYQYDLNNAVTSFFTLSNIVDPIDIALGYTHSMALQENGEIKTWGENSNGQLGDGTTTMRYTPQSVKFENGSIITTATKITASKYGGCAILEDSSVYCWGRNNYGQLGDGTTTTSLYAKPVKGFAFE